MNAQAAALGQQGTESCALALSAGLAGEIKVVLVAQLFEFLQPVNENKKRRRQGGFCRAAFFQFLGQSVHHFDHIVALRQSHAMRHDGSRGLQEARNARSSRVHDHESGIRILRRQGNKRTPEEGLHHFVALSDQQQMIAALPVER